jgi:hypothetical protein
MVFDETEHLLLGVRCFDLSVEVVAAIFKVSDPDFELLVYHSGIHGSFYRYSTNRYDQ